jgi:hypothetical protein
MGKDVTPEWLVLPKARTIIDSLLEMKGGDTRVPSLAAKELSLLRAVPELAGKLGSLESLVRLRGEPVWTVMPFHVEVK